MRSGTLKFNRRYFIFAVLIFVIEILIAKFAHDRIIRPHVGDFLVVILIYCFIKSFIEAPVLLTALSVLIFSYAVETLQYFNIVSRLGLQKSKVAKIIIGNSFGLIDLIAYTAGIALVVYLEKVCTGRNHLQAGIKTRNSKKLYPK
ncbi:MAG: DUF2809 domain-containing protein [Ginsengibacter sp.]